MRDTDAHTVRHKALLVAYGLHESGRREVIGIDVGRSSPRPPLQAGWVEASSAHPREVLDEGGS